MYFSGIWPTKHNLFRLCTGRTPIPKTLSVCSCVFVDVCVHFDMPGSTVWSLMLLKWCRVSGLVPLGRGHPPAGTPVAGRGYISLHYWLLHTSLLSASRASKHHLFSMTPTNTLPLPTLSATPLYWFPPRSDFPRAVSRGSSFLTNYLVKFMASSPELQPLQNTFREPP